MIYSNRSYAFKINGKLHNIRLKIIIRSISKVYGSLMNYWFSILNSNVFVLFFRHRHFRRDKVFTVISQEYWFIAYAGLDTDTRKMKTGVNRESTTQFYFGGTPLRRRCTRLPECRFLATTIIMTYYSRRGDVRSLSHGDSKTRDSKE